MNEVLVAALTYARRGWPVFPVHSVVERACTCRRDCSSPGKHPLVRRGVHEATTDKKMVCDWWTRWPFANVALATGDVVVIDIDLPTAFESLDRLPELRRTLVSLTGGGGLHLFYASDRTLRNHASRLPGVNRDLPGIDLRGHGGYVVAPPSLHTSASRYEWLDEATPMAPAPSWLREPERDRRHIVERPPRFSTGAGTAYGLAVLRDQLGILRCAQVGVRNHTLNRCAFIVALTVCAGHLAEEPARHALHDIAIAIGLTDWETTRTIESAFSARRDNPG